MSLGRRARAPQPLAPLVCRWDLDKTYLRSEFATVRQLLRTAFERGQDKIDVPGVVELVKAIASAAERRGRPLQTFFLSASPPQIGRAIRDKLALDGIAYDGIIFKNQLQNIRHGKFRHLREHVGFKLTELLRGRLAAPPGARELLFGDDWESDALIYAIYADIVAGRLRPEGLRPILGRIGVDPVLTSPLEGLAAEMGGGDAVDRIFINLERRTPPAVFRLFGPRVVPTFNYFQTAAVLAADDWLDDEGVARVGSALIDGAGYTTRRLENSLADLVRRGHLTVVAADRLAVGLRARALLPPASPDGPRWRVALRRALGRLRRRRHLAAPPPAAPLDYDAILDRLHPAVSATAAEGPS